MVHFTSPRLFLLDNDRRASAKVEAWVMMDRLGWSGYGLGLVGYGIVLFGIYCLV